MNEKKLNSKTKSSKKKWLVIGVISVVIYVASLFLPLISPYAKFPLYLVKCGGRPIVGSNFAAGYSYYTPEDKNYSVGPFDNAMFCTEDEAKSSGYRHISPPFRD